jgi:uncharacterized protein (TIGR03086 family)
MDPIEKFAAAVDIAYGIIANVPADRWSSQSPCSEWDVRAVANHLIGGAMVISASVRGQEIDLGPLAGDLGGADPAAIFRAAADDALAAFNADPSVLGRTVKLPFGEYPGAEVANLFTNDFFGHAWDIAKGSGQSTDIAPAMAEAVLADLRGYITADLRTPGMYDAERPAPADAPAADRMAAFMGRQV